MRRVPIILLATALLLWLGGCESRRDHDNRVEKLMENPPSAEQSPEMGDGPPQPDWYAANAPQPDWYAANAPQPKLWTDPQTRCVYFIHQTGYMTPRLDRRGRPLCPDREP